MIILQESGSAQNIDFIPREYTSGSSYTVRILNESTNKQIYSQATTGITQELYYNRYNAVFPVKQDIFYILTILSGTDVIFKDKIFCTNQVISDYTVNNGEYVSNDTDNEFIFA